MDALVNGKILIGDDLVSGRTVLIEQGRITDLPADGALPQDMRRTDLEGGLLAPGFIDLQINGGGGLLLNDAPTLETIARIGAAHRRHGVTGFLPTLITTDRSTMVRAIDAVRGAIEHGVPGVLGIHLEGPHLNPARKGVHDASHIRPLGPEDPALLTSLGRATTLITLAPECVPPDVIRDLARKAIVFAGHTDGSHAQITAGLEAGVRGFTHLYNAMSQLGSREPGAVGAALTSTAACGIIVDGHHVHPASVRLAYAAKPRGALFLVSDAMPPVGTQMTGFALGGQWIEVREGRCTTSDERLAGSTLDMASAVRNAVAFGIPLVDALRMASTYPADVLGDAERGRIAPGARADLVLLDEMLRVRATWIGGDAEWTDEAIR